MSANTKLQQADKMYIHKVAQYLVDHNNIIINYWVNHKSCQAWNHNSGANSTIVITEKCLSFPVG